MQTGSIGAEGASTAGIDEAPARRPLWRADTRSLVGSALMGVFMVLLVGLGDRIDASVSGGAFPVFGGTAWAITMALSALFFGLPGALIAGEIQALMDIAFGVPLAPAFIIANAAGPLIFALVAARLPMRTWLHYLLALLPSVIVGNLIVSAYLAIYMQVPVSMLVVSTLVVIAVGIVAALIVVPAIARKVWRSRLLDM